MDINFSAKGKGNIRKTNTDLIPVIPKKGWIVVIDSNEYSVTDICADYDKGLISVYLV